MSAPEWRSHPEQPAPPPVAARASAPVPVAPADPLAASVAASAAAVPDVAERAAPVVTSAPLARVAVPEQPGGPPEGPGRDGRERGGPSGRVSRLHIGWHTISRAGLRRVTVAPAAGAGLLLGRNQQQVPVPLRVFTPEAVRLALVGGVWAAQLLIFRAFSLGARVIVVSTEPQAWSGFGERATGQYNRLAVTGGDPGRVPEGTAQMPTLVVYDLGMTGPAASPPLGAWSTQLTILRQLDRPGLAALQEAQLTLMQRLGGDEATLASSALRLRPHSGQFLQFMADDMVALVGEGEDRYVFLNQTGIEQQHVGPPRR